MKKYDKYKGSGIEWIGKIPEHWKVTKIKKTYSVETGSTPKSDNPEFWDGDIDWLTPEDLSNDLMIINSSNRKITPKGYESCGTSYVERDSVVLATRAPIGNVKIVGKKMCFNQGCKALQSRTNIKNHYIYYFLKSYEEVLQSKGRGSTFMELPTKELSSFNIIEPKESEQNIISNYLDEATKKLNKVIENKERQIELLKEKEEITINKFITKGIDNKEFLDSGIAWIGKVPKNWQVKKIKRLSIIGRGASPRPIEDPKYFDDAGEFSWVRISDVTASNKYLENTTQKLSDLGSSLSVKQYPGDLFISICGSVGKPIITKIKCCIHDGFVCFQNLNINREYLYYIFYGGEAYKGYGNWGTQLNLNTNIIGKIPIPVPNEKEQEKIVEKLNIYVENTYNLILSVELEISKLEEYKKILINDVVTGKMKVTA